MSPKSHHLIVVLIVLVIILGFSYYINIKGTPPIKEEEKPEESTYVSEEVEHTGSEEIPAEELPSEEEIKTSEESEKEVEILNVVTIEIANLSVKPKEITISPGTTVIWVNKESAPHKIVAYDRLFYGQRLQPGESYNFTFTKEGTHKYFDAIFAKNAKLRGTITVQNEPLPITGGVIGVDLDKEESDGKFALLSLLFIVFVFALSYGIHTRYSV